MLIGFTGTHSTGKTTLLEALSKEEEFKNYELGLGWTRSIRDMGFKLNEDGDENTQKALFMTHLYNLHMGSDQLLMDRTLIDVLAYATDHFREGKIDKEIYHKWTGLVYNIIQNDVYDKIYYIPPEIPLITDDTRSSNENYRNRIDVIIKILLEELGVKFVEITGTVEERVQKVKEDIFK